MHVYAWIYNGIVKYQTHDFSSHMIFGNKKDNKMCVPSIYREFNDLKLINETCFNIMYVYFPISPLGWMPRTSF